MATGLRAQTWALARLLAACLLGGLGMFAAFAAPVQIGGSYVADNFANMDGGLKRGTAFLGLAERTIEADGAVVGGPGDAVLDGWVRAGIATARINPVDRYLGGGILWHRCSAG